MYDMRDEMVWTNPDPNKKVETLKYEDDLSYGNQIGARAALGVTLAFTILTIISFCMGANYYG